jgi:hypothetical protein
MHAGAPLPAARFNWLLDCVLNWYLTGYLTVYLTGT